MTNNTIQDIELSIKEAKELVEVGNSLQRLMGNRDFKRVILEGFFKEEAIRLVHLKADPSFQTADRQHSIVQQMDAIGSLSGYLSTVLLKASQAAKSIELDETTRDEMLAEEIQNG